MEQVWCILACSTAQSLEAEIKVSAETLISPKAWNPLLSSPVVNKTQLLAVVGPWYPLSCLQSARGLLSDLRGHL